MAQWLRAHVQFLAPPWCLLTPVPGDLTPSSDLWAVDTYMVHIYIHAGKTLTHMQLSEQLLKNVKKRDINKNTQIQQLSMGKGQCIA